MRAKVTPEADLAPSAGGRFKRLATHGTFWTALSFGTSQGLRFGSNLILTRLLFPEAFGLIALVNSFVLLVHLFSDIGAGASIVQNERGDERGFQNTAWTIQVARGLFLTTLTVLAAEPFAAFFEEPELAPLLRFVSLGFIFLGFVSTNLHAAHRHVSLKRVTLIEITSAVLKIVAMVIYAAVAPSAWALAIGVVVGDAVTLVLSHALLPGIRNRFHWDREAASSIIHFGKWIFLSTMLTFGAEYSDRLIFGTLVPVAVLGVYNVGVTLAVLPLMLISKLGNVVIFPVCSRVWNEKGDMKTVLAKLRWPILVGSGWILAGFAAGGQTIIDFLYDDRYAGAGWVVQFIALSGWMGALGSTVHPVFIARGQTYYAVAANAAKIAGFAVLITIGWALFDFPGAVGGYAAAELIRYGVLSWALHRCGLSTPLMDAGLTSLTLASALAGYIASLLARSQGVHILGEVLVVFVVVSVCWIPAGLELASALRSGRLRVGESG